MHDHGTICTTFHICIEIKPWIYRKHTLDCVCVYMSKYYLFHIVPRIKQFSYVQFAISAKMVSNH